MLVLDDYHVIDAQLIDHALTFLLEHMPPQMHLVIASREDPPLHLGRLRARGQLAELRAADLRFTPDEAVDFLNRVMGLALSAEEVTALETTYGRLDRRPAIGGASRCKAARMRPGSSNRSPAATVSSWITCIEEVLQRQPEEIQDFLLRTSILNRMCGPLCEC